MDDEQAICRVCRSENSTNNPLYHPCKCSGSIRFVHQDCLVGWLLHSKKKYCELCEYTFVFTPIYRQDMPKNIPLKVISNQSLAGLGALLLLLIRCLLVVGVWLVILPTVTLWTWRFYFWSGENIGFKRVLSDNVEKATTDNFFLLRYNWREFLTDCFEGQIIIAVVVLVFVAAYLFREWVIQNTGDAADQEDNVNINNLPNQSLEDQHRTPQTRPQPQPQPQSPLSLPLPSQQQMIIDNTSPVNESNQSVSNERELIESRLEELRRELERRKNLIERQSEDHNYISYRNETLSRSVSQGSIENFELAESSEIRQPLVSAPAPASSVYHLNSNRPRMPPLFSPVVDDDSDDDISYTSGAQSPFVSWRDYQQGLGTSNNNIIDSVYEENINQTSSTGRTWRASGFSRTSERIDYFNQHLPINLNQEENGEARQNESSDDNNGNEGNQENQENIENQENHDNQEDNVNNEEQQFDIDGVLEAIGIRGNPLISLKNSTLMFLMINLCLCIAIWIPYILGRSLILFQPTYFLNILGKSMGLTVDFTIKNAYYALQNSLFFQSIKNVFLDFMQSTGFTFDRMDLDTYDSIDTVFYSFCQRTLSVFSLNTNILKPYWYPIQQVLVVILKRWRECALRKDVFDRLVCTIFGYALLITLGSWYLSRSKRSRPGTTNEVLRHQGVFLKVLLCIFLELVLFPTVCGLLIDISTLPLFAGCSFQSRLVFIMENSYSGVFLHWFVGTGFVFQYSTFTTLVREVVRPGVLWFINNPKDPQFHPVQEMAEQPILLSLKKMFTSAIIYFILLMIGMGLVTLLISNYSGIYPVLWPFNTPFSILPIDLLAIQFILPPILNYMVPREFSKKALSSWWHIASHHLRLTSYMFGGRYPDEEGVFIYKSWLDWIFRRKNMLPSDTRTVPEFRKDGILVQAPKRDNILVSSDRRMLIPVDPVTFQPLNELERQLGHPAVSQPGTEDLYTTIVYIPPYFKTRVVTFLFLFWLSGSLLVCSFSVIPLLLGRNIFNTFMSTSEPVHDIYSFGLGSFVMITMSYCINWIGQKHIFFEENERRVHLSSVIIYVYNHLIKLVHLLFITVSFGSVLPVMIGVSLDLYILMPLRLAGKDVNALDLNLLEDWAFGLTILCLFYGVTSIISNNTTRALANQLTWEYLTNISIKTTVKQSLIPAIAILTAIIAVPTILTLAIIHLFAIGDPQIKILIFRCTYPIVFCCACLILAFLVTVRLLKMWLRSIRDKIYLIGKRLHNLENID